MRQGRGGGHNVETVSRQEQCALRIRRYVLVTQPLNTARQGKLGMGWYFETFLLCGSCEYCYQSQWSV